MTNTQVLRDAGPTIVWQQRWKCSIPLVILLAFTPVRVFGQLEVLSAGDVAEQWRGAQIASLQEQLEGDAVQGVLKQEMTAQLKWLSAWQPGKLSKKPLSTAVEEKELIPEPTVDPEDVAAKLRKRLFGPKARPTVQDTKELQRLLAVYPKDVGVRQLHLHWLDQTHYRKQYCDAIADAAKKLASLLTEVQLDDNDQKWARAYCLYRRGRALAYRELPDVVKERPIREARKHEAALLGAYSELNELAGKGRPEFVLLDIRMLRRDLWYGRALEMLELHGNVIERRWFLKKRRDLLRELGWSAPSREAAAMYAQEFPQAVAKEAKDS